MEQVIKQIHLSEEIRNSDGVDVDARSRNSYKLDVKFNRLFVDWQISRLMDKVGIHPVLHSHFSQTPIEWCCCNSSEPLHSLSLLKKEWILLWIRDWAWKVIVLWSLKANKEGVWLGEKNTLITWINTSEIPAWTICAVNEPRKIFARAINQIIDKRDNRAWPSIIVLDRFAHIFPLRLIFPLSNQTQKAQSLYEELCFKRQELLEAQNIGSFFEFDGEKLKKTESMEVS